MKRSLATKPQWSRRRFVTAALAFPGAALVARAASIVPPITADSTVRYRFFTATEAAFVEAAVARLIPEDELGPGALQAGVPLFIDSQLSGPFGKAADWYMQGPFVHGTPEQGYQSQLTPAGVYRAAITAIDAHARQSAGKPFAMLAASQQDELLLAMDEGRPALSGVSADTFFKLLWQNTQEGYFADPLYGGNQGFAGWKLIGYPGPRYNYVDAIRHHGVRYPLPTVGLLGRDPARRPATRT